jgi:hypothetical protein
MEHCILWIAGCCMLQQPHIEEPVARCPLPAGSSSSKSSQQAARHKAARLAARHKPLSESHFFAASLWRDLISFADAGLTACGPLAEFNFFCRCKQKGKSEFEFAAKAKASNCNWVAEYRYKP